VKKFWKFLRKQIPEYALVPLGVMLLLSFVVYEGASLIARNQKCFDLTLKIDEMIPLISWTAVIYLGCYLFWIVNYILSCRRSKKAADTFMIAEIMGEIICFICFIFFPCTLVRPEVSGNGFFDQLIKLIYSVDYPVNLLPSLHCFASWMCYLGIKDDVSISKGYKIFSAIFAIMVCVSTLTTKQHVFVDTISGVLLAQICYQITVKLQLYKRLEKKR